MIITEYVTPEGINPCGSSYTQIFREGKTKRIALNSLLSKKSFYGYDIVKANIYRVANIYNRNSYILLASVDVN